MPSHSALPRCRHAFWNARSYAVVAPHDEHGERSDPELVEVARVRDVVDRARELPYAGPEPLVLQGREGARRVAVRGNVTAMHRSRSCFRRPFRHLSGHVFGWPNGRVFSGIPATPPGGRPRG